MKFLLALLVAALPTILTGANADTKQSQAETNLRNLEDWFKEESSGKPAYSRMKNVETAMAELQKDPDASGPLLRNVFIDSRKGTKLRVNVAQILRDSGIRFSNTDLSGLEKIIQNSKENSTIRIDAANFFLMAKPSPTAAENKIILDTAFRIMKAGGDRAHIRILIMRPLAREAAAQDFMLRELERGVDPGPTMEMLGRMKLRRALRPMERVLQSHWNERGFPKSRVYLAWGQIGGAEAFDLLAKYLKKERDLSLRNVILHGIGLTKAPRAKELLLHYLLEESKNDLYYSAALDGLRFLGDPTVIPILEAQLENKARYPSEIGRTQGAIEALKSGNDKPEWLRD